MFKAILYILLMIWEFPQNFVGFFVMLFYKPDSASCFKLKDYPVRFVYLSKKMPSGISLGNFIIIQTKYGNDRQYIRHEYGHTIQSMCLGPLYLLVIGLPSLVWNLYQRSHQELDYYSFFTEKWADRLGGVERDER